MAYSVAKIALIEAWTSVSEFTDDLAFDVDNTTCMTNGTTGEDCDELKEGELNLRIVIDVPPDDINSLSIRFYLNGVMTAGNNSVVPYTDANSVSGTNANEQDYSTAGQWINHVLSGALLAELGNVNGQSVLRFTSEGGAKSKIGEVNIDMDYDTYKVEGITKDNSGSVLGSCTVSLFKNDGSGVFSYIDTQVSNVSTGVYSFTGLGSGTYMVYAWKADAPDVFDATDNDITAVLE